MSLYTYRAKLARIVDGDTIDVNLDQGLNTWRLPERCRLAGIEAEKTGTPEGDTARTAVEEWFRGVGDTFYVQTLKNRREQERKEKYGRYLAWIYDVEPEWPAPTRQGDADVLANIARMACLNTALILGGHAVWYWGVGPRRADVE